MSGHIAIVSHKYAGIYGSRYVMKYFSDVWREKGFRVSLVDDTKADLEADIAILHIDLSVIPENFQTFIRRFPVVINGAVNDISKRSYSSQIVHRSDHYKGDVIVKTNFNCGGIPERRIRLQKSPIFKGFYYLQNKLPWSLRSSINMMEYPVFDSVDKVPWPVWYNPNLIVEKFIPERKDGLFCLRTWVFFGDKETNSICYSNEPVIKSGNIIRREVINEIPDELRQMRKDLGFDFGKFDYAIVDGRVVLYDANRTPTFGNFDEEKFLPTVRMLAEGINEYL